MGKQVVVETCPFCGVLPDRHRRWSMIHPRYTGCIMDGKAFKIKDWNRRAVSNHGK